MINKHLLCALMLLFSSLSYAQQQAEENPSQETAPIDKSMLNLPIFDDYQLVIGYAQKYQTSSKEILLEMVQDDTLTPLKTAAAVRILRQNYIQEIVSKEKKRVEKILIHRLRKTDSPFIQVEIMIALCHLDRYEYFDETVPELIKKLDHYNEAINTLAYEGLESIITDKSNRAREARTVFNTLRKILFLSRNRLTNIENPPPKLAQKLKLLRWSIKILGTQELKKLPKEVLNLL